MSAHDIAWTIYLSGALVSFVLGVPAVLRNPAINKPDNGLNMPGAMLCVMLALVSWLGAIFWAVVLVVGLRQSHHVS